MIKKEREIDRERKRGRESRRLARLQRARMRHGTNTNAGMTVEVRKVGIHIPGHIRSAPILPLRGGRLLTLSGRCEHREGGRKGERERERERER